MPSKDIDDQDVTDKIVASLAPEDVDVNALDVVAVATVGKLVVDDAAGYQESLDVTGPARFRDQLALDTDAGTDTEVKFTEGGADRFGIRFRGTASDRLSIYDYGSARFVAQVVGGVLDLSGAAAVRVPDADADGEAIAYNQAAAQFQTARVRSSTPRLEIEETDAPADEGNWQIRSAGSDFRIVQTDDGGTIFRTPLVIRADGTAIYQGDSLEVPAPTDDDHAATKVYVDDVASPLLSESIWIPAHHFAPVQNLSAPESMFANRYLGWHFDDTGGEMLTSTSVLIPSHWGSFDFAISYYADATGDWVCTQRFITKSTDGDDLVGGGQSIDVVTVSDATTTHLDNFGSFSQSADTAIIQVGRDPQNASDTLAGTIYFYGVKLTPTSFV